MSPVKRLRPGDVLRQATPAEQMQIRLGNLSVGRGKGTGAVPLNVLSFAALCTHHGVDRPDAKEYEFHNVRKWLLDVAWTKYKVGLEVHGGHAMRGGNKGHSSIAGLLRDWEKVTEAQLLGWVIVQVARSKASKDDWCSDTTVELCRRAIEVQKGRGHG